MKKIILCIALLLAASSLIIAQELVHKSDSFVATDEKYKSVSPIRWYTVQLKAANRLAIRVASIDFTPLIVVSTGLGKDVTKAGTGGSASFSYATEEDATIRVGVSATGVVTGGAFFVRIAMLPAQVPIKMGDRIVGELTYDDEVLDDDRPVDWYTTPVKKGQRLAIAAWSDDFNPSIVGTIPGGADLKADESVSGHDAARFTAPQDGTLRFGVAAENESDAGSFNLQVVTLKDARPIALGETATGSLKDSDDMLAGKPMDAYRYHGKANTRVVVKSSSSLDMVLYVQDALGNTVANDDATDNTSNAEITYPFITEGDIEIRVYARDSDSRGDYKLSVVAAAPLPSINMGDSVDGSLGSGDELSDGKFADRYLFTGKANQQIVIDLESEDFDTVLQIIGVNGEKDENDDKSGDTNSTNSSLTYTFPQAGTIQIIATTVDTGESGSYTLSLSESK